MGGDSSASQLHQLILAEKDFMSLTLMDYFSAAFMVSAACCIVIAAFTPILRMKGRIRLAGSLLFGTALSLVSLSQYMSIGRFRAGVALCGVAGVSFI